jgi:hypothetical protein
MTCELEGEDAERAGGIFRLPPPGRTGNRAHAIVSADRHLPSCFATPIYALTRLDRLPHLSVVARFMRPEVIPLGGKML